MKFLIVFFGLLAAACATIITPPVNYGNSYYDSGLTLGSRYVGYPGVSSVYGGYSGLGYGRSLSYTVPQYGYGRSLGWSGLGNYGYGLGSYGYGLNNYNMGYRGLIY